LKKKILLKLKVIAKKVKKIKEENNENE